MAVPKVGFSTASLANKQFKITAPGKGLAKMALLGGALMGAGSIIAYGYNIGLGLSGISTLSLESLLAVIGLVVGITAVTKWMEKHFNRYTQTPNGARTNYKF